MNIKDIALAVNAYAPKLDEEEKIKFSMYIHNQYAYETDLIGLNLSNEWHNYKAIEGESDEVETISWSSSNPTGEVR